MCGCGLCTVANPRFHIPFLLVALPQQRSVALGFRAASSKQGCTACNYRRQSQHASSEPAAGTLPDVAPTNDIPLWPDMNDLEPDSHVISVQACYKFYLRRMRLLLNRDNSEPLKMTSVVKHFIKEDKAHSELKLQAKYQEQLIKMARDTFERRYGDVRRTRPAMIEALERLERATLPFMCDIQYPRSSGYWDSRNPFKIEVR